MEHTSPLRPLVGLALVLVFSFGVQGFLPLGDAIGHMPTWLAGLMAIGGASGIYLLRDKC